MNSINFRIQQLKDLLAEDVVNLEQLRKFCFDGEYPSNRPLKHNLQSSTLFRHSGLEWIPPPLLEDLARLSVPEKGDVVKDPGPEETIVPTVCAGINCGAGGTKQRSE